MARNDVVVIGAGHNGLVAAAYLARGGRKVLILEQGEVLGGMAAVDEIAPGVRAPAVFATVDRFHPGIVRDLALERHGLRIEEGGGTLLARPGDDALFAPAGGLPEGLTDADARGLAAFESFLGRVSRALEPALAERLPDIEASGFGDVVDLLALGWRLRRLGRREMPAAMRMLPMALRDVVEEHFDDDRLQAAVAWIGLTGCRIGPWAPGGAFNLIFNRPAWYGGLFPGARFSVGTPLGEVLAEAAKAAGAEVRTGARATRIKVHEDSVTGVVLESGEEIEAACVLSAVDPRTTLLDLLEPGSLETDVLGAAENIRGTGSVSVVRAVVAEPPAMRDPAGGKRPVGRIQIGPTLRYLEEASDSVKYGRLPERPVLELTVPTAVGTGLAPRGQHVVHAWVQYTPRHLREGDWAGAREELGRRVVQIIDDHAPGFARSVEHLDVLTPEDIETRFGIRGGHPYHVEMALDQALYMRPIPGCHDGGTPVEGLYLGGPGIHPGGGVTGLPGKLASERLLEDWKDGRRARTA